MFDNIKVQINYLLGFVILGSPSNFNTNNNNADGFNVNSSGDLNNPNVNNTNGVRGWRAVVSLVSNISSTGLGVWNNPYIVN